MLSLALCLCLCLLLCFPVSVLCSFSTVYSMTYPSGANPSAPLIQATDNQLYSTSSAGGHNHCGVLYKLNVNSQLTTITSMLHRHAQRGSIGTTASIVHHFSNSSGCNPSTAVYQNGDGYLYGTTVNGGRHNCGVVYKLLPSGEQYTVIHHFTADEDHPQSSVAADKQGVMYGTTPHIIYSVKENGDFSVVQQLSISTGDNCGYALILATNGYMYGVCSYSDHSFGLAYTLRPDPRNPGSVLYTIVHNFTGDALVDGVSPVSSLYQASDGYLYGSTEGASAIYYVNATIYRMSLTGDVTVIYSDEALMGGARFTALTQADDGALYGIDHRGFSDNSMVVFRLQNVGSIQHPQFIYHNISRLNNERGESTSAPLIQADNKLLYSTEQLSGTDDAGSVFSVSLSGATDVVYSFTSVSRTPQGGLTPSPDGSVAYGVTQDGGMYGVGTVYRIIMAEDSSLVSHTVVHNFQPSSGYNPQTAVTVATDSYLYGTTSAGGSYNQGTVYKLSASGSFFAVLFSFDGSNSGTNPGTSLIQASDGVLYGATIQGGQSNAGTVFSISTSGSFTLLHTFTSPGGVYPLGGLIQAKDHYLYGTTSAGGEVAAMGVVYRLPLLNQPGQYTEVYRIPNTVGRTARAGLVQDPASTATHVILYGLTAVSVFSVTLPQATGTVVYTFPTGTLEPNIPVWSLFAENSRSLLGLTRVGGKYNQGVLYRLSWSGTNPPQLTVLVDFTDWNNNAYDGHLWRNGTTIYGTLSQGGIQHWGSIWAYTD